MPRKRRNPPDMLPVRHDQPEAKKKQKSLPKSQKPTSKKSDSTEILRRVSEVYRRLIQRHTRIEILQYATETWQITERQAETYLARARELIRQQIVYNRDEELVYGVELMKFVIRKTLTVMDYQRAISAQREINHMIGLYAPTKMEHKQEDEQFDVLKNSLISKLEQMAKLLTPDIPG